MFRNWTRLQNAKELIDTLESKHEIQALDYVTYSDGTVYEYRMLSGVYVHESLMSALLLWISPEFHLYFSAMLRIITEYKYTRNEKQMGQQMAALTNVNQTLITSNQELEARKAPIPIGEGMYSEMPVFYLPLSDSYYLIRANQANFSIAWTKLCAMQKSYEYTPVFKSKTASPFVGAIQLYDVIRTRLEHLAMFTYNTIKLEDGVTEEHFFAEVKKICDDQGYALNTKGQIAL